MKYFSTWWSMKNDIRFEYVPVKYVWFCFVSIVSVYFSHKTENFYFESHWNTLYFFNKENMVSDLTMSHGKISDPVWFPLLGFT